MQIKLKKTGEASTVGNFTYPEDCFLLLEQLKSKQITQKEFDSTIAQMLLELVMADKVDFIPFPAEPEVVKNYNQAILGTIGVAKNKRISSTELFTDFNKNPEFRDYYKCKTDIFALNLSSLDTLKKCKERNNSNLTTEQLKKIDDLFFDIVMKLKSCGYSDSDIVF